MTPRSMRQGMCCLLALFTSGHILAQSSPVFASDEYRSKLRVTDAVRPVGDAAFGEKISLYDGSIQWSQVDVEMKGSGPAIEVRRQFTVPDLPSDRFYRSGMDNLVGDWKLELPRIDTISAVVPMRLPTGATGSGWFFIDDVQRCSALPAAPAAAGTNGAAYAAADWWHGYGLRVAGENQDILRRGPENTNAPSSNGPIGAFVFSGSTTKNWAIGCVGRTANGAPGEGFIAVAPDGTRYWLDWLVQKPADSMTRGDGGSLARRKASMLVSRVQDRLGNTVAYQYDTNGSPTTISASDGRQVRLTYDSVAGPDGQVHRLRNVTATGPLGPARSWTYNYDNGQVSRLTGVVLPDGSSWSFGMNGVVATQLPGQTLYQGCGDPSTSVNAAPWVATMRDPNGLTGQFTARVIVRGLSGVPKTCVAGVSGTSTVALPNAYLQTVIVGKTYSGAGFDPMRWTYAYSPPMPTWSTTCPNGSCQASTWTDVVDPQSRTAHYVFSNRFDASNSQLMQRDLYDGMVGSRLLRSEIYSYAPTTYGPWPTHFGASQQTNVNTSQIESLSPLMKRTILQDGDTYTRATQQFDVFGQDVLVTRGNSTTPLHLDLRYDRQVQPSLWVVDRVARVTNVATGEMVDRYDYDSLMSLVARWRFGRQVAGYVYDGVGNIVSETDGKGAMTQYANFMAGWARSIRYPDGTQINREVDGFGNVTRLTDQSGFTTTYDYDAAGRLRRTSYSAGDGTPWAPVDTNYQYVDYAEPGLAGGHWRRDETEGARMVSTFFDALLRPVLVSRTGGATNGDTQAFAYDWRGRRTFASYPVDGQQTLPQVTRGTRTDYDGLGRETTRRRDADGTTLTTTTSWLSRATKQVAAPGTTPRVTTTAYFSLDEPAYDRPIHLIEPEGVQRDIDRDVYGYPTATRQQGSGGGIAQTVLIYDTAHRLCRRWSTERGSEMFGYDGADNLIWNALVPSYAGNDCGQQAVSPSARTDRAYDPMNRLKSVVYPGGGEAIAFTYDARGYLASTMFNAGTWTYGRNGRGLLTAEVLSVDGHNWPFTYEYDATGARSATHYPDGSTVAHAPNGFGQPTAAGNMANGATWFPDGLLRSVRFGNGTTYVAQETLRALPGNVTYGSADGSIPVSMDMVYDDSGNLSSVRDLSDVRGPVRTFAYDGRDRLIFASGADGFDARSYAWDANDNLLSVRTGDNTLTNYVYDGRNLLTSVVRGGQTIHSYQYDPRGLPGARDGVPVAMDAADRLAGLGSAGSFAYDSAGRRVKSVIGGTTTYFAYTADGRLMWTYDASRARGTSYVYLGTRLVALNGDNGSQVTGLATSPVRVGDTWSFDGWACSTGASSPISIRLYTNDTQHQLVGTYRADQASKDGVLQACRTGASHDFHIVLSDALRQSFSGRALVAVGVDYYDGSEVRIPGSDTTMPPPGTPPDKAVGMSIRFDDTANAVVGDWIVVGGADTVQVWKIVNGERSEIKVSDGNGIRVSERIDAPLKGYYAFEVVVCNAAGCSEPARSAVVEVTRPDSVPMPPYPVTGTAYADGSVAVAWQSASGASYRIEVLAPGDTWRAVASSTSLGYSYHAPTSGAYRFRVRSCVGGICGNYATSESVSVSVPTVTSTGAK